MQEHPYQDRRDSFRIEMKAYVAVEAASEDKADASDYFKELQTLSLLSEFKSLNQEFMLASERIKDLATKKSIDIVQRQLQVLAQLDVTQAITDTALNSQIINISEGGCSAVFDQEYSIGDQVALAIVFSPSYYSLFTMADVIDRDIVQSKYRAHFQFNGLTEKQSQELLKHMFQAQTDQKNNR